MYEVRSYDEKLHPDLFKRNGVLGRIIYFLNFLRWKLEVFVQYLVLRFMMREQKFSLKKTDEVLATFRLDVEKEKLECLETSPLRVFPLLDPPKVDTSETTGPIPAQVFPADGSRGQSLDMLFQKYAPTRNRRRPSYEMEDDQFEPLEVPEPQPPEEDKGPDQ